MNIFKEKLVKHQSWLLRNEHNQINDLVERVNNRYFREDYPEVVKLYEATLREYGRTE